MRFFASLVLLFSIVAVVGCGGGPVEIPETTEDSVTQTIRPILERLAETGDLEEGLEARSYIEEDLAGIDQAKSDALMKDWLELEAMSSPADIKAKAQEMIDKL